MPVVGAQCKSILAARQDACELRAISTAGGIQAHLMRERVAGRYYYSRIVDTHPCPPVNDFELPHARPGSHYPKVC